MKISTIKYGLLLLSLTHLNCSWIFVKSVPDIRPDYNAGVVDCTDNVAAPVIDILFMTSNLVSLAAGIVYQNQYIALSGGLFGSMWAFSAAHGFSNTSKCRDLKAEMARMDRYGLRTKQNRCSGDNCETGYSENKSQKEQVKCHLDTECKGDRICVDGQCHSPTASNQMTKGNQTATKTNSPTTIDASIPKKDFSKSFEFLSMEMEKTCNKKNEIIFGDPNAPTNKFSCGLVFSKCVEDEDSTGCQIYTCEQAANLVLGGCGKSPEKLNKKALVQKFIATCKQTEKPGQSEHYCRINCMIHHACKSESFEKCLKTNSCTNLPDLSFWSLPVQ